MAGQRDRGFAFPEQRGAAAGGRTSYQQGGEQPSSPGGLMGTVKDTAQELASTAAQQAGNAWDNARQGCQDLASSAASTAEEGWDTLNTFIRRYPVPTLLGGMALGFILAEAMHVMSDRK